MSWGILPAILVLTTCYAKSGMRHNRHLGLRGSGAAAVSGRNGKIFELDGATLRLEPEDKLGMSLDGTTWVTVDHIRIGSAIDNRWELQADVAGAEPSTGGGKRILLPKDDKIGDLLAYLAESDHRIEQGGDSDALVMSAEGVRSIAVMAPYNKDHAGYRFLALLRAAVLTIEPGSQPEQVESFVRLVDDVADACDVPAADVPDRNYMKELRAICRSAAIPLDLPKIHGDEASVAGADFLRVLTADAFQAGVADVLDQAQRSNPGNALVGAFCTIDRELLPKIKHTIGHHPGPAAATATEADPGKPVGLADKHLGGTGAHTLLKETGPVDSGSDARSGSAARGGAGPGAGAHGSSVSGSSKAGTKGESFAAAGSTVLENNIFKMLRRHYASDDVDNLDTGAPGRMELDPSKGGKQRPIQALMDIDESDEAYSAEVTTRGGAMRQKIGFMTARLRLSRRGNLALAMWAVDEEHQPPLMACLRSRYPDPALPTGALDCLGLLQAASEAELYLDSSSNYLIGALLKTLEGPIGGLPAAGRQRALARLPAVYAMGLVLHSLVEMNHPGRLAGAYSIVSALPDDLYAVIIVAGRSFADNWQRSLTRAFPGIPAVAELDTVRALLMALQGTVDDLGLMGQAVDIYTAGDTYRLADLAVALLKRLTRSGE